MPRRRAWADRMTGTEVIYDTVARAAPYAVATPTSAARSTPPPLARVKITARPSPT
jgi:hypothetical protein